eukprot:2683512-Alexandrium_andersonii.AAC.1
MVHSAMAGQPAWPRSCRAWAMAHASATDSSLSAAVGKAPRTIRPSSATLVAQAADEAPGGQPSAT